MCEPRKYWLYPYEVWDEIRHDIARILQTGLVGRESLSPNELCKLPNAHTSADEQIKKINIDIAALVSDTTVEILACVDADKVKEQTTTNDSLRVERQVPLQVTTVYGTIDPLQNSSPKSNFSHRYKTTKALKRLGFAFITNQT